GIWLRLELREPFLMFAGVRNGAGTVAGGGECQHELLRHSRVVRFTLGATTPVVGCLCMASRRRVSLSLSLQRPRIGASEARSFAVEPSLEFGRVADEEPIKQRSTVHLQRRL